MDILEAFFSMIGVGCIALAIFVWLRPGALHALQGMLAAREAYMHAGRKAAAQKARRWARTVPANGEDRSRSASLEAKEIAL